MTNYRHEYKNFRLSVPARFNWAFETFDGCVRDPAGLAMLWVAAEGQPRRITSADLAERSRRFATLLAALGVSHGERVFVMLPRTREWCEIVLGSITDEVGELHEHVKTITAP